MWGYNFAKISYLIVLIIIFRSLIFLLHIHGFFFLTFNVDIESENKPNLTALF